MKSDRRHELQQNQLADWLAKNIEAAKPYANMIFGGLLLGIVVAVAVMWWNSSSSAAESSLWREFYDRMDDPARLADFVEQHSDTEAGHLAAVCLGDRYLLQAAYGVFGNKSQAANDMRKAIENYKLVLDKGSKQALLQRATFGLARARESAGELPEAIKLYEQVVQKWPESIFATQSTDRLRDLRKAMTKDMYDRLASYDPTPAFTPSTSPTPPLDLRIPDEPPTGTPMVPDTPMPSTTFDIKFGDKPESQPAEPPKEDDKPAEPPKEESKPADAPKEDAKPEEPKMDDKPADE